MRREIERRGPLLRGMRNSGRVRCVRGKLPVRARIVLGHLLRLGLGVWTASEYNGFAPWDKFAEKGKVVTIEDDTVRILDKPKVGINVAGSDLDAKQAGTLFKQIQKIVKGA